MKTNRLSLLLLSVIAIAILFSCKRNELEFESVNQYDCLIYLDKERFNGIVVTKHENGEVAQKINVVNGEIKGEYTSFDYSGGILSQGEVLSTLYENVYLKRWVEGGLEKKSNPKYFYTIFFCKEIDSFNEFDREAVHIIIENYNIDIENLDILLGDRQINPIKRRYYDYATWLDGNV